MEPLLVVLDLDETLIHSSPYPLNTPEDGRVGPYFTYKRPGVDAFLAELLNDSRFVLGVYTASSLDYATEVLSLLGLKLDQLAFLFSYQRVVKAISPSCGPYSNSNQFFYFKDLKKVRRVTKWPYRRMIAVDDIPGNYPRQYSNLVTVSPFRGDRNDTVLPSLLVFLQYLASLDNVRPMEKRGWYNKDWRPFDLTA